MCPIAEHSSAVHVLPGPRANVSCSWCASGLSEYGLLLWGLCHCYDLDFTSAETLLGGDLLIQRMQRILCSSRGVCSALQLGERAAQFDS